MTDAHIQFACYRRAHPQTGHIHSSPPKAGQQEGVGQIERTRDPSFFFHAEKYRGSRESVRIAIMDCERFADVELVLTQHPLNTQELSRWTAVRELAMRCAVWFGLTQHPASTTLDPNRFDGLDVTAAAAAIRVRLQRPARLVIAGSRELKARLAGYALIDWFVTNRDLSTLGHGLSDGIVDEVVSGNANGADAVGEEWAMKRYVPVQHFPAAWELGKHAGFQRNEEMAKVGTHLLAFHLQNSKGTAHIIDMFVRAKKPYWRFDDADVSKMQRQITEGVAREADDLPFAPEV